MKEKFFWQIKLKFTDLLISESVILIAIIETPLDKRWKKATTDYCKP